jgi:hypothetical protein
VEEAMKTRSALTAVLAVSLLAGGLLLAAGEKATLSGEVIDSACYIKSGAKGVDHAKCAAGCAKAGIPLALLTDDGKVVWLSSKEDMESPNEMLTPYAGRKVSLEGQWFERGGAKLFAVEKVTPVPAK